MKNIENYSVTRLTNDELISINGGDKFARDFGSILGIICGNIKNLAGKMDSNSQWLA